MASRYKLQWVEKTRRWRKQYKGKQYYFPLVDGETKASSYRRCLGEWEAAKREADASISSPSDGPIAGYLLWLRSLQDGYRRAGDVVRYTRATEAIRSIEVANLRGVQLDVDEENNVILPERSDVPAAPPANVAFAHRWLDSALEQTISTLATVASSDAVERPWDRDAIVPADRTIGGLLESFRKAHPKVAKSRVYRYRDWADVTADVSTIDGAHCRAYRNQLEAETTRATNAISRKYAKDCLSTFTQFLRYLVNDVEALEQLPKNLSGLTIEVPTKSVQTIEPATIRTYLIGGRKDGKPMTDATTNADERIRLFILLMMNCGMTQIDISELSPSQVNWTSGRIVRKRSKLENASGNVPTSNYALWPETLSLLTKHRSGDECRVLVNANGKPLVTRSVGGEARNDSVRLAFKRFRERLGMESELPLKHIRKTSASIIADKFGEDLATLFLGDAPTSTAGKHYIAINDDRLDDCLVAVRDGYRIADVLHPDGTLRANPLQGSPPPTKRKAKP
ncbi:hypothetical protein [Rosistilla oblonga]|uniref:hypothetical protein n=1 Tax=Rosistilla oblonga TaxID=2527990 RepID=UPI003A97D419